MAVFYGYADYFICDCGIRSFTRSHLASPAGLTTYFVLTVHFEDFSIVPNVFFSALAHDKLLRHFGMSNCNDIEDEIEMIELKQRSFGCY